MLGVHRRITLPTRSSQCGTIRIYSSIVEFIRIGFNTFCNTKPVQAEFSSRLKDPTARSRQRTPQARERREGTTPSPSSRSRGFPLRAQTHGRAPTHCVSRSGPRSPPSRPARTPPSRCSPRNTPGSPSSGRSDADRKSDETTRGPYRAAVKRMSFVAWMPIEITERG